MFLLRFSHSQRKIWAGDHLYPASCDVRNELNNRRKMNQVVKTYPSEGSRLPYFPRVFPLGVWKVKKPIWTDDPEYWPVKIPTTAVRNVFTWETEDGSYNRISEIVQEDAFYHLHHAKNSRTTLGCIRIAIPGDAATIAKSVERHMDALEDVYIEVTL